MKIDNFNIVYENSKELDKHFSSFYGNSEDIILKNKLELLVELGELCNESRCFKYWTKKEVNKELVLYEYADVILMILYFFNQFDISLNEEFPIENNLDIIDEFIYLYNTMSKFKDEYNKDVIKDIFVNTLRLGKLLNLNDKEVIDSCLNKININIERFEF